MSEVQERTPAEDEVGYGAATEGDMSGTPEQDQPQTREPASEGAAEQNDVANTDEAES